MSTIVQADWQVPLGGNVLRLIITGENGIEVEDFFSLIDVIQLMRKQYERRLTPIWTDGTWIP